MRHLCFLLISICLSFVACAQTSYNEILDDPSKAAGLYSLYPEPVGVHYTDAPKGYKPFYISHYGRHGSRTLVNEADYTTPRDIMHKAAQAGALTDLGLSVAARLEMIYQDVNGREGELTQRGAKQHHDIAQRMYRQYPEVFDKDAKVSARSTVIMRCAHSMAAFCEGLKELNPALNIPRESGKRYMKYMSNVSPEAKKYTESKNLAKRINEFEAKMTKPDRLMASLFSDSKYLSDNIKAPELMRSLYLIAIDQPNTDTDITLADIFTTDELYNLWQAYNYRYYNHMSNPTSANGAILGNAKPLLSNIIESAEAMIASGNHGADLRFGHDSCIVPLLGLMMVDGCYGSTDNPAKLADVYADYKITPMATNLQMIFYKNKKDDIIVKLLLNEREVTLPIKSDIAPYYHWSDLLPYLKQRLEF